MGGWVGGWGGGVTDLYEVEASYPLNQVVLKSAEENAAVWVEEEAFAVSSRRGGWVGGCGGWVWWVGVVGGCGGWVWWVGVVGGCGGWVGR